MIAFAMLALFRLFANNKKLNITLIEPKRNKRENKNMQLYAYGHFRIYYQDAYFEPLWLFFSKPDTIIFLSRSQVHIKVSKWVLSKLSESLSIAYYKHPKWQH
jgi:hypothetical protein